MRVIVTIGSISPKDVGEPLISDLRRIYPEGYREFPSGYRDFSFPRLPEGDQLLASILERLARAGMRPFEAGGERDKSREFVLLKHREYEPEDFEPFDLLRLDPVDMLPGSFRDPLGRAMIDRDAMDFDMGAAIAGAPAGSPITFVPSRIKRLLEGAELRGIAFRPTVLKRGDGINPSLSSWEECGAEPWWELSSPLRMPPMSRAVEFLDADSHPMDEKARNRADFRNGLTLREGYFTKPEPRYTAESLTRWMPRHFDLARSYEPIGSKPEWDFRLLIASKRFYDFCRELSLRTSWVPVHIEHG